MKNTPSVSELLGVKYPLIVAPMFLISNTKMVIEALNFGVSAAFPALNYRTDEELIDAIRTIKKASSQSFGVNLIVNKSNPKYKKQLEILVEEGVPYIITSLGSPAEVIEKAHQKGIKVFCDVTNLEYALKVEKLGADAVIAVNSKAGGHCGNISPKQLIEELTANCSIPVITAGGVATGSQLEQAMSWGAAGASVGTIFIACDEADISQEYKQAMVDYGAKDIILTDRISGSHLTIINTPYVQKIGAKASWWERTLLKNKWLKKYVKMFIYVKGMNQVKKAAEGATYKTFWCAGPSIEYVHKIQPIKNILEDFFKK